MTYLDIPAPDNRLWRACDPADQKVLRALNDVSRAHTALRGALMAGDVEQASPHGMAFAAALQELVNTTVALAILIDAAADAHDNEMAESARARETAAIEAAR